MAAKVFGARIQALLGELAMGRTHFEVRFDAEAGESAWTESGVDVAEYYLSANVGEDLGRSPASPAVESSRV